MDSNTGKQLSDILSQVKKLRKAYEVLVKTNKQLEDQLSHLKVEADQYKHENINLKKELEEPVGKSKSLSLKNDDTAVGSTEDDKNRQMRLQLDECIKDIDQCIQIMQAK